MCLRTINGRFDGTDKTVRRGWKVFITKRYPSGRRARYFMYRLHNGSGRVPRSQWIAANTRSTITAGFSLFSYKSGFHIYTQKPNLLQYDEKKHELVEVKYKGILTRGTESRGPVDVAKYMYVPRRR